MKRVFGGLFLAALVASLMYGYVVTQNERSYWQSIERGDAALGRNDSYAAIEAFSAAIERKPDSMAAHLKRGEAYRRRGEYKPGLRDLQRAAEIDPLSPFPLELLGDVHYALASHERDFSPARFGRAVDSYQAALALDENSGRVQYKLGLAAYRSGQLKIATRALRRAIQLDARVAEAHHVLGLCLRAEQQSRQAAASLEKALSLSPAFVEAREELADTYAMLGRHDDRLDQLQRLLDAHPSAARERALADAYAAAGYPDRAVGQLRRAAERYPNDARTYVALGQLWLDRADRVADGGDVELRKAIDALSTAAGLDRNSETLALLGRAQLLAGQFSQSVRTLQQATSRFPIDPRAFLYLAEVNDQLGRRTAAEKALVDYATLVRAETLPATLLVRLAEAQLRRGLRAEAIRIVDAALDKEPENPAALSLQKRLQ